MYQSSIAKSHDSGTLVHVAAIHDLDPSVKPWSWCNEPHSTVVAWRNRTPSVIS